MAGGALERVGCHIPSHIYTTRVEVSNSDKHSSLLAQEERDKSQCFKSLTAAHQSGVLLENIRLGEKCLTYITLAL